MPASGRVTDIPRRRGPFSLPTLLPSSEDCHFLRGLGRHSSFTGLAHVPRLRTGSLQLPASGNHPLSSLAFVSQLGLLYQDPRDGVRRTADPHFSQLCRLSPGWRPCPIWLPTEGQFLARRGWVCALMWQSEKGGSSSGGHQSHHAGATHDLV